MKIKNYYNQISAIYHLHKGLGLLVVGWAVVVLILPAIVAATGISSGYLTNDPDLRTGMAVALSAESVDGKPTVERARISQSSNVIGIAVDAQEGAITIASSGSQIYVTSNGEVEAYVTDLNGEIKKDDKLAISPVRGVLMKAEGESGVIGTALADFDSSLAEEISIKEGDATRQARLNKVKIALHVGQNQNGGETTSYLERLGKSLTQKSVSELRILAALAIFVILLVIEGGLMYGAVSGAVNSLGRNPLSHRLIYKALFRTVGIALTGLSIGLIAIYTILWL
jgi:hypothetical protein